MLAKLAEELPTGDGFLFEPKWDGFRAIVFRSESDVFIQSRDLRPLDRYFPELHELFLEKLPPGCVIDGEIVIAGPNGLDFDALQLRLHPAASRAAKLARETPAGFVGFDLLAVGGLDLRSAPQQRTAGPAGGAAGRVRSADLPDADDARSRRRGGVAGTLRRRGSRRRHRQASGWLIRARQARDDQGQARAHGRLRRRRVPLAQERYRTPSDPCCSGSTIHGEGCSTWA